MGAERPHVAIGFDGKVAFPHGRAGQVTQPLQTLLSNGGRSPGSPNFNSRLSSARAVECIVESEYSAFMNRKQSLRQEMWKGIDANNSDAFRIRLAIRQ